MGNGRFSRPQKDRFRLPVQRRHLLVKIYPQKTCKRGWASGTCLFEAAKIGHSFTGYIATRFQRGLSFFGGLLFLGLSSYYLLRMLMIQTYVSNTLKYVKFTLTFEDNKCFYIFGL